MKTDPALHEHMSRVVDALPVDVERHLDTLHGSAPSREWRRRVTIVAFAAGVAALGLGSLWQLRPGVGAADRDVAATVGPGTIAYTIELPSGAGHRMALVNGDGTGSRILPEQGFGIGDDEFETWFPELAPDGRHIAYLAETDGGDARALITNDLEGGHPIVLEERASITGLTWSPDSSRIAYVAYHEPSDSFDVFVVRTDGSGTAEPLATGNWHEVSWSPAGELLVLSGWPANGANTGHDDLYLLDVESGALTQLTNDEQRDGHPSWSPDGSTIVFARQTDPRKDVAVDLYLVPAAGGELVPLLESPGYQGFPVWSPDGTEVLFTSFAERAAEGEEPVTNVRPLGSALQIVSVADGEVRVLLDGGDDNLIPSGWMAEARD